MIRTVSTILIALALTITPSWGERKIITNDNPNPEWVRPHPGDRFERGFAMCLDGKFLKTYPGYRISGYYRETWGVNTSTAGFMFDAPVIDQMSGNRYVVIGQLIPRVPEGGIEGRDQFGRLWWFARNAHQLRVPGVDD